jgi:hypothetical protein
MNKSEKMDIFKILTPGKSLFWDKREIDPARDGYVIAERILEFGTEEEIKTLTAWFGEKFLKKIITESRVLSPKTVNYFALYFNIRRDETRCFSDG